MGSLTLPTSLPELFSVLCIAASLTAVSHTAAAQVLPETGSLKEYLKTGPVVFEIYLVGGDPIGQKFQVGQSTATPILHLFSAGLHLGKVVASGRGAATHLELATEFEPFWYAVYPHQTLLYKDETGTAVNPNFGYSNHGVSLTPLSIKAHIATSGAIDPWLAFDCAVIYTTKDFPQENTANVNFGPKASFGVNIMQNGKRSLGAYIMVAHISNGGTGMSNPGIPISVQIGVRYGWWKVRK